MNRGRLERIGTLRIARKFARRSRCLEKLLLAKLLRNPGWWLLGKTWYVKARIRKQIPELAGELSVRYRGILWQVFRRGGLKEERLANAAAAVWQLVTTGMCTLEDYRIFSKILWGSVGAVMPSEQTSLKPKFMLRQFVDELPRSDERAIMRILAYCESGARPEGQEALRLLSAAYRALHKQLLARIEELIVLTDGTVTPEMIVRITNPFNEYDEWLFNS